MSALAELDPATYSASALHHNTRAFPETNCYTDIWIELLHARGLEPAAAMAAGLAVDFEGDQWTFLKPPAADLALLYGIDVHEMQLYRPLVDHVVDQLARGRTMIVEVDSYHLPDTVGLAYGEQHVKTAIAVAALDPDAERLAYFHGRGLHEASGADFRNLFRTGGAWDANVLPPYAELVRFDSGLPLEGDELRAAAHRTLARHLSRRPHDNPWLSFGEALSAELPAFVAGSADGYHAYAFATVRQAGAAFEAAQSFVDWALGDEPAGRVAGAALGRQVEGAKALLLRLARRREFDPSERITSLAAAYDEAIDALGALVDAVAGPGPQSL
jgi:Domain of unknown function (DUF1839)